MRDSVRITIGIVAAVAAAVGVRLVFDHFREQAVVAEVDGTVDRIRDEGEARYPELPPPEALERQSSATIDAQLEAETDPVHRGVIAAGNFFGIYLMNTRQRVAYCQRRDVDIAPFVDAFERGHAAELRAARTLLAEGGVNEEALTAMLAPQLGELMDRHMENQAASRGMSPTELCWAIAADGPDIAARMHISKVQPAVYRILSGANE